MSKYDYYLNKGDDFDWAGPIYKGLSDLAEAAGDDYGIDVVQEGHYMRHMQSSTFRPFPSPPSPLTRTLSQNVIILVGESCHQGECHMILNSKRVRYNAPASALLTAGAASFISHCFANGTYGQGGVSH